MKKVRRAFALVLTLCLSCSPSLAFAQLGAVTPPVETLPPAPIIEPVSQIIAPPADTTGPVISGVVNVSLLPTTAEIVWTTDELAVSSLRYGTSESLGSTATLPASALLVHGAVLLNLTPGTTYHYCIDATDIAGNMTH